MRAEDPQRSPADARPASPSGAVGRMPTIQLPKGGGAIRGMGEKFAANPVTGTGSMSLPIATSPGRSGFGPQLSLTYDSGAGQSVFGLGWNLGVPSIVRKTDKGLPRYLDDEESDVFILSGAEDLVPLIDPETSERHVDQVQLASEQYKVHRYRPRVEGLFARIERWKSLELAGITFWRTISRDNVTTWYGRNDDSRIADPDEPTRIFQWLICQTNDDKGNVAVYEYIDDKSLAIDTSAVWEANRVPKAREANRYLKRIRYGNPPPSYLPKLDPEVPDELPTKWMFEVVFDYGDHAGDFPTPVPNLSSGSADGPQPDPNKPLVRPDPFSTHRSGFEIRTQRLCYRVLMFHHFADAPGVGLNCLVRSTNFDYKLADSTADAMKPGYSMLQSVTQWSFQSKPNQSEVDGSTKQYESRQLPPVKFTYSRPMVNQAVKFIDATDLENLPVGTQGPGYRWIDLDGEGLSGVLAETTGAWYYKPGLGDGKFGPVRAVARVPAMAMAGGSHHQFMDLAGNGQIDVVDFSGPTPGFHERDRDEGWKRHVPFASLPNIDWQDANLRFLDLTGDGHADVLITEQDVFTWYPSLDKRGFDAAERTRQQADEDSGPKLIFADGTQTIFLADMCGDGLTDLVRIRNGEVCYWPNQGYGRFGRKVTLGNSPHFDSYDMFDPSRIRLTDIDGSGPIDIIYLGREGAKLYFNRAGNSLSKALTVELPVATENLGAVQVADLLGNGTACLVWNSHLPGDARQPVSYIDLMGGKEDATLHLRHEKPHLLIRVENNLGASTDIEYTPSTRFYLQDRQAGMPWITRLPFPVHCVSRVTVRDLWRGTAFSSTYSYHHGFFDGVEREFRGFGRVEQVDVEDFGTSANANAGSPWVTQDHRLYQPLVKTITWYHTGAALERRRVLDQFAHEYFPQRFAARLSAAPDAFRENPLPDPELPAGLTTDEWREALRACKGMTLRQEVYELDLSDLTGKLPRQTPVRLFSAATHNCHIQCLQRQGRNLHAVFLVTESEAVSYHYELAMPKDGSLLEPDPRISHTLNLRHDELGNPQQSVVIGYPRWKPVAPAGLPRPELIQQVQAEWHMVYTESHYTADVVTPTPAAGENATRHHRLRLPFETLTFELRGIPGLGAGRRYYTLADFRTCDLSDTYGNETGDVPPPTAVQSLPYHMWADGSVPQKRLVEHARTRYFDDAADDAPPDSARPLDFGLHGPRGLKFEDYKLALTEGLLDAVFRQSGAGGVVDDKLSWEALPGIQARDMLDDEARSGYWQGPRIGRGEHEYWMRSGTAGFSADAQQHFFLPERYTDPFGNATTLEYDPLRLFVARSTDAMGNTLTIAADGAGAPRFDYRVLAPIEMVDASGNHSEVVFDIRGLVVAAATKGKLFNGSWQGDHLDGWTFEQINPPETAVADFCIADGFDDTPNGDARRWLGTASVRFVYHLGESRDGNNDPSWLIRMAGACAIAREIHVSQPGGTDSPLQVSLECSDGSGAVLMKKQQAEAAGPDAGKRWIVNGLTVVNNKSKPVQQFEPEFSPRFGCELPQANGVSTITFYDAAGRPVRVEMPDGTFSRVEFSPWFSRSFDANDTVLESTWYAERGRPNARADLALNATPDERAAWLAAHHADTPSQTHFDSLGREVITIAHNRTAGEDANQPWVDAFYLTFTRLDAEGKPLWIRDARNNLVMQYITPPKPTRLADDATEDVPSRIEGGTASHSVPTYDIAGNLLFQHSMDAGDRWMLMDAAGKPMLAWDFNEWQDDPGEVFDERRLYLTEYDALHRPSRQWLSTWQRPQGTASAFKPLGSEQVERFEYQDALANDPVNLNGQLIRHYDPSGLVETIRRDFAGNVQELHRTLVQDARSARTDWATLTTVNGKPKLEDETYIQITEHDALGRMARVFNWHRTSKPVAVYEPQYNARGLLQSESLRLHATKTDTGYEDNSGELTHAIKDIRYNAKGQKELLALGNGTVTQYEYDPATFRLRQIFTSRPPPELPFPGYRSPMRDPGVFQQLLYTYDAVGNITELEDRAFKPVYFNGGEAEPRSLYVYDALYRLTWARGRETAQGGDAAGDGTEPAIGKGFPVTDQTLRMYEQRYVYDEVGNFITMRHFAGNNAAESWTRHYETDKGSNRLLSTQQGQAPAVSYGYDTHGSMLNLASLGTEMQLRWDQRDMIRHINLGGGGKAWYQYDSGKQRTRKSIQRTPSTYEERIYLGGMERFRRWTNGAVVEEIETLHLFEGEQRVLMVDDVNPADPEPRHWNDPWNDGRTLTQQTLFRYQYSNHLGSVSAELDHKAKTISNEEFHPYGTSACRAMDPLNRAPTRRYRYSGLERDDESGLGYHGARHFLILLGRWCSCDPLQGRPHVNSYEYVRSRPIHFVDLDGAAESNRQLLGLDNAAVNTDLESDSSLGNVLKLTAKQTLYDVWNGLTAGFVEKHDVLFEARETGKISESEYVGQTAIQATKSAAVTVVSSYTGGALGKGATTLGARLAGGVAGGFVGGVAVDGTSQAFERFGTGELKELSLSRLLKAGAGSAVVAGLASPATLVGLKRLGASLGLGTIVKPGDLGLRNISSNPKLAALWDQAVDKILTSAKKDGILRNNALQRLFDKQMNGNPVTNKEFRAAFELVRNEFTELAGISLKDLKQNIHHWNWPGQTFAGDVVNRDKLFIAGEAIHSQVHEATSSAFWPNIDKYTMPIDPSQVLH
jgi:RHS repeat-associated protein